MELLWLILRCTAVFVNSFFCYPSIYAVSFSSPLRLFSFKYIFMCIFFFLIFSEAWGKGGALNALNL